MTTVKHWRMQYGVGQGGFHAAQVSVTTNGRTEYFDYVYDCGSFKLGSGTKLLNPALHHYHPHTLDVSAGAKDPLEGKKGIVNAVFLSHFDFDHLNGIEKLAERFWIENIYVPYFTEEIFLGSLLTLLSDDADISERHIGMLGAIYQGKFLFGIPLIRVSNQDENEPRGYSDNASYPPDPSRRDELSDDSSITTDDGGSKSGFLNGPLSLMSRAKSIWQLKPWNFDAGKYFPALKDGLTCSGLTVPAPPELKALVGTPINVGTVKPLLSKAVRAAIVAYYAAILKESKLPTEIWKSKNNLISMCLFSGPVDGLHRIRGIYRSSNDLTGFVCCCRFCNSPRRFCYPVLGWMGTGDALLGHGMVWSDFSGYYSSELPEVRTLLIPHHGAAMNKLSYRSDLNVQPNMYSVFSVGTYNTYGHPSQDVMDAVLAEDGIPVVVTEMTWPGFYESMSFRVKL